jgi:mannose-6-phosphate isomerase-like protein (cupin superfamily)
MPKVSKDTATMGDDYGAVLDRAEEMEGYTVNFVSFREDIDATPLYKGLPDDRCQCPHWGYVTKGAVTFRYAHGDEVCEEGDAFYIPPGHVPVKHSPGTEIVLFSPTEELRVTEAAMERNMKEMQAV